MLGRDIDDLAVQTCICAGNRTLATEAFDAYLRIDDSHEAAAAALGLMPFLPNSNDTQARSEEIQKGNEAKYFSVFAGLMSELTVGIQVGALTDVIKAAVQFQSEWWVVEALTLTIRRISAIEELKAVLGGALHLKNLDLRARIVQRTAYRAVDLGYLQLGVEAALSVELDKARWEGLRELSLRLGSAGEAEIALSVVRRISDRELASRAIAELALELAAQGRFQIVNRMLKEITFPEWRLWATTLLGRELPDKPSAHFHDVDIRDRVLLRRVRDEVFDEYQLLMDSLSSLQVSHELEGERRALAAALLKRDPLAVSNAINGLLWPSDDRAGHIQNLSNSRRADALGQIAAWGPLISFGGSQQVTAGVLEAVQAVRMWWP
jgi:hypothetical protein